MAQLLKMLTALAEDLVPVWALRPRGSQLSVTRAQFPLLASLGTCTYVYIPPHRHTQIHII